MAFIALGEEIWGKKVPARDQVTSTSIKNQLRSSLTVNPNSLNTVILFLNIL